MQNPSAHFRKISAVTQNLFLLKSVIQPYEASGEQEMETIPEPKLESCPI